LSVPVTVTVVALLAVTVKMDDEPSTIEVGLAVIVTVGAAATVTTAEAVTFPPGPVAVAV
jgi:hypothetical protein